MNDKKQTEDKPNKAIEILLPIAKTLSVLYPPAAMLLELLAPVISERQDNWLEKLAEDFEKLKEEFENFNLEEIIQDPVFVSNLIDASRVAISTHQAEKHEMLRNAILNAALPEAPDETRQKIFIRWLDELSVWHVKIMKLFHDPIHLQSVSNQKTLMIENIKSYYGGQFNELAKGVFTLLPELKNDYDLFRQIFRELHQRDLITNTFPSIDGYTQTSFPNLSLLGEEFNKFIQSPFDKIAKS